MSVKHPLVILRILRQVHPVAIELPFQYGVGADKLLLSVGIDSGYPGELFASVSGFGAHFLPLTGHPYGNAKSDVIAYYVPSDRNLVELVNDAGGTAGQCDPELVDDREICGFYRGLGGEIVRARIPTYFAPFNGEVIELQYLRRPDSARQYFDNVPQWWVAMQAGGVRISFDHVGRIVEPLRPRIIAATGIDPDTFAPTTTDPSAWDYCPVDQWAALDNLCGGRSLLAACIGGGGGSGASSNVTGKFQNEYKSFGIMTNERVERLTEGILAALARLGDDLEAGASFSAPYPPLAAD